MDIIQLEVIFEMQGELNELIGRKTMGQNKDKLAWMFQYLFAAKVECGELLDCFALNKKTMCYELIDAQNARVEAIDILHFLVSALQISNVPVKRVQEVTETYVGGNLFNLCFELDRSLELAITKNIDWKWWSKTVKEDPSRQFKAIFDLQPLERDMLNCFQQLFFVMESLGIKDSVFEIYRRKHAVNCKRQQTDYDVRHKTEEDNKHI